jgi:hypothetical protein
MGKYIALLYLLTVQCLFMASVLADSHTHRYFYDRGTTDKSRRVDEKPLLRLSKLFSQSSPSKSNSNDAI